jgi:hypothetical protein
MSPVKTLLVSIFVGVAGAVAVVVFQRVVADALGGAVAIAALIGVIWSTMRLAGDAGTTDDEPADRDSEPPQPGRATPGPLPPRSADFDRNPERMKG